MYVNVGFSENIEVASSVVKSSIARSFGKYRVGLVFELFRRSA